MTTKEKMYYAILDNEGNQPHWLFFGQFDKMEPCAWHYVGFTGIRQAFGNVEQAILRREQFNELAKLAGFDLRFKVVALTESELSILVNASFEEGNYKIIHTTKNFIRGTKSKLLEQQNEIRRKFRTAEKNVEKKWQANKAI